MEFVKYVTNWTHHFIPNSWQNKVGSSATKRRADLVLESPKQSKMARRSLQTDDFGYSAANGVTIRRGGGCRNREPPPVVDLDDDDDDNNENDVVEVVARPQTSFNRRCMLAGLKFPPTSHATSTPQYSALSNGNGLDVGNSNQIANRTNKKKLFPQFKEAEAILQKRRDSAAAVTSVLSPQRRTQKFNERNSGESATMFPFIHSIRQKLQLKPRKPNQPTSASTSWQSRLYANMLNSKHVYSTMLQDVLKNKKAITNITGRNNVRFVNSKPKEFIDLTATSSKSSTDSHGTARLSVANSIEKVLNRHEVLEVKDSDSEIEIINPPSPKPDIKVERVNSLKDYMETYKGNWKEFAKDQKSIWKQREEEIASHEVRTENLSTINAQMRLQQLENQVKRCLSIHDSFVLVDDEEEELEDDALPQLTQQHVDRVVRAQHPHLPQGEVLVTKFSLSITRRDMVTLAGLNWLNDEVINFYMNLIIERGKIDKFPNAYAMNTFFYPKLEKDGYTSIRRWTRKIDFFSYDIVAVPIHMTMHWCMAIIDFKQKTITYYDSMNGDNNTCLKLLRGYLEAEHLDKKKSSFDTSGWSLANAKDIPVQMNGSDCGVFACTFAEYLTRNARLTFSQQNMPYFRQKMVLEILDGQLIVT